MRRRAPIEQRGYGGWGLILVALAALLALAGCAGRDRGADRGQERATIALRTDPAAPGAAPATLLIDLTAPDGAPIGGARVTVVGNMAHAGMQPVNGEARERAAGSYAVEGFRFTMGGDWTITVSAILPDGGEVRRTFPIAGVSGALPPRVMVRG